MAASTEQLSKWVAYRDRADGGRELGLADSWTACRTAGCSRPTLPVFEMAYLEALLADMVRPIPSWAASTARCTPRVRATSRAGPTAHRGRRLEVVRAHHRRIPAPAASARSACCAAEMARRRGHMPIRQLMQKAAPAVQALKPVLMMSPLSVAQFLTPGA